MHDSMRIVASNATGGGLAGCMDPAQQKPSGRADGPLETSPDYETADAGSPDRKPPPTRNVSDYSARQPLRASSQSTWRTPNTRSIRVLSSTELPGRRAGRG